MLELTPEVRRAARHLVRELQMLDGHRQVEGFGFSECHLLTELQDMGQATASELAERLVLEKSTISRLCASLTGRGLVSAQPDKADGRKRLLRLTAKGTAAAIRINRTALSQVDGALTTVSADQRRVIAEGMSHYARALRYARLSAEFAMRPIEERDNPAVARIIRDVMTEYGAVGCGYSIEDPEVDNMFEAYPDTDSAFFVLEKDGQVLGCGGVGPLAEAEPDICELRKMYLLSEARGTGIGARLLKMCLDSARRLGYRKCYLETLEHMTHARHLYRKYGFETLDRPQGNTGHSSCNYWMIKDLEAADE